MPRLTTTAAVSVFAAAALFVCGTSAASAAETPASDPEGTQVVEEQFAVMLEETAAPSGDVSTQEVCVAVNRVDYPHISTTSTELAVQAHGNWDRGTCNASLADVTTQIDRKNPIGLFQAVGVQGTGRLAYNTNGLSSGGAGRVTAHYPCNGTAAAPFRAWTSIDMVDLADTQTRLYSPETTPIECG